MKSAAYFWRYWEPRLHYWYYRLPFVSYASKRALVRFLRRRAQWLVGKINPNRSQSAGLAGTTVSPDIDYACWREQYIQLSPFGRRRILKTLRRWESPPLLDLVVDARAHQRDALEATLNSIRKQIYSRWNLTLVGAEAHVNESPTCVSLTQALIKSTADYVCILDVGDVLHEAALYYMAAAIREHPSSGLLYSDEDRISAEGGRVTPYFKPDWNPELSLTHDMAGGLVMYRRDALAGVTITETNPSRGFDLALQVSERLPDAAVRHVPLVLFSRPIRQITSVPTDVTAVQRALIRRGISGDASPSPLVDGAVRVRYRLPKSPPLITLIIPTRNGLELLRQCLGSLLRLTDYPSYELLVVDNGSDDLGTLAYLDALPSRHTNTRVLRAPGPFNFSRLNNLAVSQSDGELVGLLNNDIEIIDGGWLREMVSQACRPEVGAVGARLLYPDGRIQHAGVILGLAGAAGHVLRYWEPNMADPFGPPSIGRSRLAQNLSAVTAACLVVRKALYLEVGGLDEDEFPVAYNDVDFCLKLQGLGYRNVYTPFATLIHHESASRGSEIISRETSLRFSREMANLQRRWITPDFTDPAYNPNFSMIREDCAYGLPPKL